MTSKNVGHFIKFPLKSLVKIYTSKRQISNPNFDGKFNDLYRVINSFAPENNAQSAILKWYFLTKSQGNLQSTSRKQR